MGIAVLLAVAGVAGGVIALGRARRSRSPRTTPASPAAREPVSRAARREPALAPAPLPAPRSSAAVLAVAIDEEDDRDASEHALRATFQNLAQHYKLPALPVAVTQAMQLARDPEVDITHLSRVLAADPALVGRIMALARSPLYTQRRQPQTLEEATALIGLSSLRRLLMTAGMDMLRVRHAREFEQLWRHSLATALAAHTLAGRTGAWAPDQAYLAGLLHDVAHMLLLRADRERFLALWTDTKGDLPRALESEQRLYGRDHAFLGASILFQWRLDADIVDAVMRHHETPVAAHPHAVLLGVAEYLASEAGYVFPAGVARPGDAVLADYGLSDTEALRQAVSDLGTSVDREAAFLR